MNKILVQNFRSWVIASVCRRSPPGPARIHQILWQGLRKGIKNMFQVDRVLPRKRPMLFYGGQSLDRTIKLANISEPLVMMRSAFTSMNTNPQNITECNILNQKNVNVNSENTNIKPKSIIEEDMRHSQCKMPTIICRHRGALNNRANYLRRLTTVGFRNFTS